MNRIWQIAYFVAHRILRVIWFVLPATRPPGAFVAVWCNGRILAIKTSYQPFHTFPGGISRRGEDPRLSAVREVQEEVGISLAPEKLIPVTQSPLQARLDRNGVSLFAADMAAVPTLTIDNKEITSAEFLDVNDPRISNIWLPFRSYVEQARNLPKSM